MSGYKKVKSPAKEITSNPLTLKKKILSTMEEIAEVVGATLGPSGRPVLIERQDYGLPNVFTKDGVTVFRSLGFQDATKQAILEAARDASTRTVAEAGDGTTSAAVLAEAIVKNTLNYCEQHPKVSPQKVVRRLEKVFKEDIEPQIKQWSIKPDEKMLYDVAKISANGDAELASAVMKSFELVGDDGNITILEQNGPSKYEVESLKGFPINVGFEESTGGYFNLFLNDRNNNRCFMEKPVFILYFGAITEVQTILPVLSKIANAWGDPGSVGMEKPYNHNVVLVATSFSDSVLAWLANNFAALGSINVYPLVAQKSPVNNGQLHFLMDLAAVTGAKVFDPITAPLDYADFKDFGYGIESFEATRYRSTVLGICDESLIIMRSEEVKQALSQAESILEKNVMQDRIARLVGGVARLKVFGSSSGELREKRDRAEDAICAVRGAQKHGCLPGGCWTHMQLISFLQNKYMNSGDEVLSYVLLPSLKKPLHRILNNCGMISEEISEIESKLISQESNNYQVFDAMEFEFVNAINGGVLDSTPAVLESLRNSLSIASLLGTCGGIVVWPRDEVLERQEASETEHFMRSMENPRGRDE